MSIESPGFHSREGWFFRREDGGSVRLTAPDSAGPGAHQTVVLDANTWASAVASVSAAGDSGDTFRRALDLHNQVGPRDTAEPHPAVAALLRYFAWGHLPPRLQEVSRPFAELAHAMAARLSGPELTVGLRKLLEAKDCCVRAALDT